jgi:hypothetical protein
MKIAIKTQRSQSAHIYYLDTENDYRPFSYMNIRAGWNYAVEHCAFLRTIEGEVVMRRKADYGEYFVKFTTIRRL